MRKSRRHSYLRRGRQVDALTQYCGFYKINIASPKLMLYKTNLLIRRNCVRQGKASEGNEAVVTYGDLTESKL